jgi:hypothetical protein
MYAKVSNLFQSRNSDSEGPDVNLEEEKFLNELAEILPVLVSIIETAHGNMTAEINRKHPDYLNHLSKSIRMHEQIKGLLHDTFGTGVRKMRYNRFGLFVGNFVMLFKKLDDAGRPSNIKTVNSEMLITQGKLNFPGQPIIVHVGYVVDRSWEQLKRIYAVRIVDKQIEWISNLKQVVNNAVPQITQQPAAVADDAELVVQPKNKQKENLTGS